jgi:type IV secretion system protein VirB2
VSPFVTFCHSLSLVRVFSLSDSLFEIWSENFFRRRIQVKNQKKENHLFLAILIVGLCAIPQVALAAPAWESALQTIVGYVTGSTARYIAILAVVGFGFAAFLGRIAWRRALEIVVAIAIVFGAAKIVDMFAGSGGTP